MTIEYSFDDFLCVCACFYSTIQGEQMDLFPKNEGKLKLLTILYFDDFL